MDRKVICKLVIVESCNKIFNKILTQNKRVRPEGVKYHRCSLSRNGVVASVLCY